MSQYDIPGVGLICPGVPFTMTLQFTDEETGEPYIDTVKFPANFLVHATEDDLSRLGITIVPPPPEEPEEPEETDE